MSKNQKMIEKSKSALSQKDVPGWGSDTLVYRERFVPKKFFDHKIKVELIGGKDRGAIINIWEEEVSTLHHVWTPSDDGEWMKLTEVHFHYYNNANDEYRELKTADAVLDLMKRWG